MKKYIDAENFKNTLRESLILSPDTAEEFTNIGIVFAISRINILPGIAEVLVGTVKRISFGRTRGLVVCIEYKKISGWYTTGNFTQASFGKTVFIDKDKAKHKLQGDK